MDQIDCVRLDSKSQTIVLASREKRLPEVVYWSDRLPDELDLCVLAQTQRRSLGHGMLDEPAELSILPESGYAFPGQPGLRGHTVSGKHWTGRFFLESALAAESSTTRVTVKAKDKVAGLALVSTFELNAETDMLQVKSSLTNENDEAFCLEWMACPVLPAPDNSSHLIGFHGRYCQEFRMQEVPWVKGGHVRENRLGRTSHEHFPGVMVPTQGATQTQGGVHGFHLGWSGNHRLLAEELPDGRRQMQFGILLEPGELSLKKGDSFETPVLYTTYASGGFNGMSQSFHKFCREEVLNLPIWLTERPVHFNCWESVYFEHELEQLKAIADEAQATGAEMFVLDDGWFLGRNDDTKGLGDWSPDPVKYPDGLHPLVDHVRAIGMRFGLWFEPEMVNKDSDLYRTHPEWVLDIEGYEQVIGRHQYILDLSREEVRAYLFDALYAMLSEYAISYVKWDMNRSPNLAAMANGQAVGHRQTQGLYRLLDQLNAAFPEVLFESCSSGGGRIDFATLKRTGRVWLSDSNDAHERAIMQRNASYFFPSEIIGSHVGPRQCHTSHRILPMSFRAGVAMTRHMGFEFDPGEMTAAEKQELGQKIMDYKAIRSCLHSAVYHRIEVNDPGTLAEAFVTEDGARFIAFVVQTRMQESASAGPLRIPGLKEDAVYAVRLVNRDELSCAANFLSESPLLDDEAIHCHSAMLKSAGLVLPNLCADSMWMLQGDIHK